MKRLLLIIALFAPGAALAADPGSIVTDEFVAYMKAVTNPHAFGLKDGRYYPYSTRYGRRIGYARTVGDKSLYLRGETPAESERHLRRELSETQERLRDWLAREYPNSPYNSLSRHSREILLDHAYTEGVEKLDRRFTTAVVSADWDTLLDQHLYVRGRDGWPDTTQNFAFGLRWIYGETGTPLRPLKRTTR